VVKKEVSRDHKGSIYPLFAERYMVRANA